jgi:hypothetical protein
MAISKPAETVAQGRENMAALKRLKLEKHGSTFE